MIEYQRVATDDELEAAYKLLTLLSPDTERALFQAHKAYLLGPRSEQWGLPLIAWLRAIPCGLGVLTCPGLEDRGDAHAQED